MRAKRFPGLVACVWRPLGVGFHAFYKGDGGLASIRHRQSVERGAGFYGWCPVPWGQQRCGLGHLLLSNPCLWQKDLLGQQVLICLYIRNRSKYFKTIVDSLNGPQAPFLLAANHVRADIAWNSALFNENKISCKRSVFLLDKMGKLI